MILPYPADSIVSSASYYTPSFENRTEFLQWIVFRELQTKAWNELFTTDVANSAWVEAVTAENKIRGKVCQDLSDG